MDIVILGPPGVGKGTQAERLASKLQIPHISTGDIFRHLSRDGSPFAARVQPYLDQGEYVPDDLTIEVVSARLAWPDTRNGFILDGFPRTCAQAQSLDRELATHRGHVDMALYLRASTAELLKRLETRLTCPGCDEVYNEATSPPRQAMVCDHCGRALVHRSDETPEAIHHRLVTYAEHTRPVISYYRRREILIEVDGGMSVLEVEAAIDRAVAADHSPRLAAAAV
jgi:adenylate kinase